MVIIYNPEFDLVDKQYTKIKKNSKLLIPTAIGATSLSYLIYRAYRYYKKLKKLKQPKALVIDFNENAIILSCLDSFLNIYYYKVDTSKTYNIQDIDIIIISLPIISIDRHNFVSHRNSIYEILTDINSKIQSDKKKCFIMFPEEGYNTSPPQGIEDVSKELNNKFTNLVFDNIFINIVDEKCMKNNFYDLMKIKLLSKY